MSHDDQLHTENSFQDSALICDSFNSLVDRLANSIGTARLL